MKKGEILASGRPADILTPEYLGKLYGVDVEVASVSGRLLVVID